ncbi:MAG: agmatinase [Bacteriovoracaceae bacterium]
MKIVKPENYYFCTSPSNELRPHSVHLIGYPFDGTACFRKGAKLGPKALREISDSIESYSPYLDLDLEDYDNLFDLGDFEFPSQDEELYFKANRLYSEFSHEINLKDSNTKVLALGGEHSISYAFIKKALKDYPDLVLIHLDAHADLRDGHEGFSHSHASIIRRVSDHFKGDIPNSERLIQYGIRSGTKEEYDWMRKHETLCLSRTEFFERVKSIPSERAVYVTLDLDYFDPSMMPGTGTPEAGGEDFHSFISLMKILKNKNFIGADVVELAPTIDPTGNSDVFATKVVREILLLLAQNTIRTKQDRENGNG